VARERNEVWDACVELIGYEPKTTSECKLWGKNVKSLTDAGANREILVAVATNYRKAWPAMALTITALEKWYSHFAAAAIKRALATPPCSECGVGGGLHAVDCSSASRYIIEQ
jgi:hypothetical protein